MITKIKTKIISGILLCTICAYTAPVMAFTKDETVYSKINSKGENYETIVSTHIENKEQLELINDISDLINIENTNGEEIFEKDGNSLIWKADKNDIYYQGESQKELPIECKVIYELDGREVNAEEIVGKTGKVKIMIKYLNKDEHIVDINGRQEKMYTPFVVVAGTMVKNDKNKNIEISNGKVINDGSKSLLLGIAMPGLRESLNIEDVDIPNDIEIKMDATDFELGNIITFVTPKVFEEKDLDFLDKLDEVYSQVDSLETASNKIQDGANTLKNGAVNYSQKSQEFSGAMKQVSEGVNSIDSNYSKIDTGIDTLSSGSSLLVNGANQLNNGAKELSSKLETLPDNVSSLYQGSQNLNTGINGNNGLANGIKTLEGTLYKTLQELKDDTTLLNNTKKQLLDEGKYTIDDAIIKNLDSQINKNNEMLKILTSTGTQELDKGLEAISQGAKGLEQGLGQLNNAASQLPNAVSQLSSGLNSIAEGSKDLETGSNTLKSGSKSLKSGMELLNTNTKKLTSANGKLTDGAATLADGASSLAEGVKTFNEEGIGKVCDLMNGEVKGLTDRVDKLTKLSQEYNNFTMLNGENDGSVKFIMIIDAIKKNEEIDDKKEDIVLNSNKSDSKK